jgi:hypothetical protein
MHVFHRFIEVFLYPVGPCEQEDTWRNPLEYFMAVYCLKKDGKFREAKEAAGLFVLLEHHIRSVVFYETRR